MPCGRWPSGVLAGQDSDVDGFGGDVPQQTRRDRERCAAHGLIRPVNEHTLRRPRRCGSIKDLLGALLQQPLDAADGIVLGGNNRQRR